MHRSSRTSTGSIARALTRAGAAHARTREARLGTVILGAVALLVAALLGPAGADAAFQSRPSPGAGGATYNPAAELRFLNGALHATWTDINAGDAKASTFGGGTWTAMPDVGPGGGGRRTDPSLAWGSGRLWGVLNDGTDEPRVKFLNAGTWTLIADPTVPNSGVWSTPSLAHDGTLLWAAWQDAGNVVRVATWNGSAWTNRASPGGGGGNAYPDLEFNEGTGTMWITFNQAGLAPVLEWVGGAWTSRGSVGDGAGNKVPGMTDVNGTVMVSWDDAPNHEVRTHALVAGTWHEVDSHRPATSANFAYPDLAWSTTGLWASATNSAAGMPVDVWEWDNAPLQPIDRRQLRADGTTSIPAAGTTTDGVSTNVNLRFSLISVLSGQTAVPWIEIRPAATPFSAACGTSVAGATFSGPSVTLTTAGQPYTANVPVTGLASGTDYHWRACSRVGTLASGWAVDSTAQRFTVSVPPAAPSSMFAGDLSAATGTTNSTTITQDDLRLSWRNDATSGVDRQRVQLVTTPLTDVVALWPLDGGGSDSSGNGHALTGAGPTWQAGQSAFGSAARFDGNDTIATAAPAAAFDRTSFTVDGWLRTTSVPTAWAHVVNKWSSSANATFSVHVEQATGRLHADLSAGGLDVNSAETAGSVVDGQWHHFAMVVDSGPADPNKLLRLYVDGALAQTVTFSGAVGAPALPVAIGSRHGLGDFFAGDVDDVRVTARALTAAEVRGFVRTRRPHNAVLWDSDTSDAGVALAACAATARCADVTYGATGTATSLVYDQARYHARAKLRTTAGTWSGWSTWDWFETMSSTSVTTTGCPLAALTFGALASGVPAVTGSDCAIGFGSTGSTVQLRIAQADGAGRAMVGSGATPGTGTINDYAAGVTDLDQGASAFGACLRAVTAATPDWTPNASCPATDGTYWNAVPASSATAGATVAHTTTAEPSAVARLRFAMRVDGTIGPGQYSAPITVEVVDPVP